MTGIRKFSMAMAAAAGFVGIVATGECVQAGDLIIGAAPSLKAAFQEIIPMFETEYGDGSCRVWSIETIRRQIEKGTAIDVFLPAAVEVRDCTRRK